MPEIPIKSRASILLSEWSALAPARHSHRRSPFGVAFLNVDHSPASLVANNSVQLQKVGEAVVKQSYGAEFGFQASLV